MLVVIWEYRKRLLRTVAGLTGTDQAQRFARNVLIAFLPAVVFGLALGSGSARGLAPSETITGAAAVRETLPGRIYRRISEGEDIQINVPGAELFQPLDSGGTNQDIFFVVAQLRNTIGNNNEPPEGQEAALSNEALRTALTTLLEQPTVPELTPRKVRSLDDSQKAPGVSGVSYWIEPK